ncbi:unnamed protein product [Calypogeia fissa]
MQNLVDQSAVFWHVNCRELNYLVPASIPRELPEIENSRDTEDHDTKMVELRDDHQDCVASRSGRDWANLVPEVLTEIFRRLPFEDRLAVVPPVCKSWNGASWLPACWIEVDMEPWLLKKASEDSWWVFDHESYLKVRHLMRQVTRRSGGQIRHLRTIPLSKIAADRLAERCPNLKVAYIDNCLLQGCSGNVLELLSCDARMVFDPQQSAADTVKSGT